MQNPKSSKSEIVKKKQGTVFLKGGGGGGGGGGWSGGAKVLGKLSVPGRPTSLDDSRARAYCACSRCG